LRKIFIFKDLLNVMPPLLLEDFSTGYAYVRIGSIILGALVIYLVIVGIQKLVVHRTDAKIEKARQEEEAAKKDMSGKGGVRGLSEKKDGLKNELSGQKGKDQ
tara:strand:+ start:518 stop:826 length:309 start_codon:yes stop_codon:yes gene_type:complete